MNLERLYEGPQQDADGFSLSQQLDETSCPEQPQETQVDEIILQPQHNQSQRKEKRRMQKERGGGYRFRIKGQRN